MTAALQEADSLLSSKQMARMIGVSTSTLSNWRCEGGGPPFIRLSPRKVAYPLGAYRKWVTEAQED